MDSIGESMGNEEEEEELYNQVLAEAGVKLEGELTGAQKDTLQSQVSEKKQLAQVGPEGAGGSGGSGPAPADGGDDDLDAMLRSLNQK